jgi:hypothetical protein
MSSDLQRFLRAIQTLSKLAGKYGEEAFLEALGRYATVKQEDDVHFVGEFLDGIGCELQKRRVERRCRQCGNEIQYNARYDNRDARADAVYCSPACRQRAYRRRVTANTQTRDCNCNGTRKKLRLAPAFAALAVTPACAEKGCSEPEHPSEPLA